MIGNPAWDRVFKTTSWFIVAALIYSTISLWIDAPSGDGPVSSLISVLGAQIFYSLLYVGESLSLAYSKIKKRYLWRKNTLLVTYLTGFFTFLLTLGIKGWSAALLDNLAISVAAAACWLYWTFRTEYLTNEQLEAVFNERPKIS